MIPVPLRKRRDCVVAGLATVLGKSYEYVEQEFLHKHDKHFTIYDEINFLKRQGYRLTRKAVWPDLDKVLYCKVPSPDIKFAVRTVIWDGKNKKLIDNTESRDDKTTYTEQQFLDIVDKSCCVIVER